MRIIEVAMLRGYDIRYLTEFELCKFPYDLSKDGFMRKPVKSSLSREYII